MKSSFADSKPTWDKMDIGTFAPPPGAELASIKMESVEDDVVEVWNKEGPCLAYPKADGWRIQIHKVGNKINLYSRKGQDYASEFPKVVAAVRDCFPELALILDVELMGFTDRGHHVDPIHLKKASRFLCYVLDAPRIDSLDLASLPTLDRVRLMRDRLGPYFRESIVPAGFTLIQSAVDLLHLYRQCLNDKARGLDGTIIKRLASCYSDTVLKLKSSDTVDAVVIGAYDGPIQGTTDRLLLAVRDPVRKLWVPISIVTRRNTEDWDSVWMACAQHVQHGPLSDVSRVPHPPTLWMSPKTVVRVTIEGVRQTKNYEINAFAARSCVLREDKGPDEATTYQQLKAIAILSGPSHSEETVQPSLFEVDVGPKEYIAAEESKQSDEHYLVTQLSHWPELPSLANTKLYQPTLFDEGSN